MALRLRPARVDDYPHFARWFPMLDSGDAVPGEDVWRAKLVARTTLAELEGTPAGYCYAQAFGDCGYIRHLVVDPTARGAGTGRALLEHVASSLRGEGCVRWQLNVKSDNVPAVSLYRAMGMRHVHDSTVVWMAWSDSERLPPASPDFEVVEPDAAQRRAMEARFGLVSGRLADDGGPGALVRMVRGPTRGVTLFNADASTAFPFRAETCEAAVALLHGLRPLCAEARVRVVVEGHRELEALLAEAGAELGYRFIHMRGAL